MKKHSVNSTQRFTTLSLVSAFCIGAIGVTGLPANAAMTADVSVGGNTIQKLAAGSSTGLQLNSSQPVLITFAGDSDYKQDDGCAGNGAILIVANSAKTTWSVTPKGTDGKCTVVFSDKSGETISFQFEAKADESGKNAGEPYKSKTQAAEDKTGQDLIYLIPPAAAIVLNNGTKRVSDILNPVPNLQVLGGGQVRVGGTVPINVSEPGGTGTFSAVSMDPTVATVNPSTQIAPGPATFIVTGVKIGTTTITISDSSGHSNGIQIQVI